MCFVAAKDVFCREKYVFVILVAALANDRNEVT